MARPNQPLHFARFSVADKQCIFSVRKILLSVNSVLNGSRWRISCVSLNRYANMQRTPCKRRRGFADRLRERNFFRIVSHRTSFRVMPFLLISRLCARRCRFHAARTSRRNSTRGWRYARKILTDSECQYGVINGFE